MSGAEMGTTETGQPVNRFELLVQSVTDYAIFMLDPAGFVGGLPQTATPAPLLLLVGIALAALAWLLRRRRAPPSDRLVSLVARAELARRVC